MVREPAVRRHDAPVHGAPGRRAARHHRPRLHRGARGGGGVLRPPAPAVRREEEHHDVRPVLARPGGGDQAAGDRGHLPRRLGDLGQGLDERGPRARSGELSARARCPTRPRCWCAPCSPPTATSSTCARACPRSSAARRRPSTFARSSSPTPIPATAATPTCATSCGASSKPACPATTSRTSARAPRSAATRAARSWCRRTSRSSA